LNETFSENAESGSKSIQNLTDAGRPVWPQFSLRQLLWAMLVLSVALAILFGLPGWLASTAIIVALSMSLAALTTATYFGVGDLKAFCLGAWPAALLVHIVVACLFVGIAYDSTYQGVPRYIELMDQCSIGLRFSFGSGIPLAIIGGVLGVAVRRRFALGIREK
jgi:hypothetical protein